MAWRESCGLITVFPLLRWIESRLEQCKPRSDNKVTIITKDGESSDELKVAETFNTYFVEKISNLKETVDPNIVKDPLERIINL